MPTEIWRLQLGSDSLPVHPVVAEVSLPPNGALPMLFPIVSRPSTLSSLPRRALPSRALPKLFPTVSLPSTLSSLKCRSLPTELSPSYFPRFPVRPPCRRFRLAPSQHPKLFLTLSRPSTLSCLQPRSLPKLFPTASRPSTLSSPSYFPRFPVKCASRHTLFRHRNFQKWSEHVVLLTF